jgi:Tol biopolymer transport system component
MNYSLRQIAFDPNDGTLGASTPLTIGRGADFQPAVSIANGSIAFSATDITFNIERIPFGSDAKKPEERPQQLTFGNNMNWFFDSSPDGKELVYQSLRGSSFHIWKMTADRQAVQLTSDPSFMDRQPQWSPDGRLIAFVRQKVEPGDQTPTIYVMSADGANPNLILKGAGGFLNWMPDSKEILFFDKNQIRAVDIHTKKTRTIAREVRNVYNVSADGRWLICGYIGANGTTDLRAIPVSGGPSIPVVDTIHEEGHPFFSVDSKWLYSQYDHKNVFRVPGPAQQWRKDQPEQVTFFPESGLYLEDIQPTLDGKFLLYSRGRIHSDIWLLSQ